MMSFEEQYYEYDAFWNPAINPFGEAEHSRIADVYRIIPSNVRSVLDAGCGNGIFCNFAMRQNDKLRIVGIDRSLAALNYVQTEKLQGSLEYIPFPDQSFDCVVSLEVIEHLPVKTFERAKNEIARVAGKFIIVGVPNNQPLGEHQTQCSSCKTWFDPDLHLRSFNKDDMQRLFASQGFTCVSTHELGHYSNYRGMRAYLDWQQRKMPQKMNSPICPVCGYHNADYQLGTVAPPVYRAPNTLEQVAKGMLKKVWPKEHFSQWLVALYERRLGSD